MIALPQWVRLGMTGVYGVYTLARAAAALTESTQPGVDSFALGLFVVAFVACSYLPARRWTSFAVPVVGLGVAIVVPLLVQPGLDPAGSYVSDAWQVDALACIAMVLLMRGRLLFGALTCVALLVEVALWAGPMGLLRFGVLALIMIFAVAAAASVALRATEGEMRRYADAEQETLAWQTAQDAYHSERRKRLLQTGRTAEAMLRTIADRSGRLDEAERAECRVLEQTIRDEIRGRGLLNDAVREQVLAHRRRGAFVQVHDDGGLDDIPADALDRLLDEVASALAPLGSDRIVIRTAPVDSPNAVTVVALTVDPVAAALGLDEDETVDLWLELQRPAVPA